jgi:Family of unknown function (DUF5694)
MRHSLLLSLVCSALVAGAASAQAFDPRQHRAPIAGAPTTVMVLGSPHLSGLPESFDPATLSLLLDRLATWKPDRIVVEGISGQGCDMLRRYKAQIPEVAESYCMDPAAAQAAAGLDTPAALAEIDRRLAAWPAQPSAADRRKLALLFLAAGERAAATVQWLRLPPTERRAADGLTPALVGFLDESLTRRNENYLIAAALAARLGHERIWFMDDHSADYAQAGLGPAYEKAMLSLWDNPALQARIAGAKAVDAAAITPAGTLAMYRHYNDPAEARRAFETDFGAAMGLASPQLYGRRYLGWWETRNLRMAANIREVAAFVPGKRLLVITGASHKGYLDAYLQLMHDMKVESPLPLLD